MVTSNTYWMNSFQSLKFQNDVIWDALNAFIHYMLPINKQKMLIIILKHVQNAPKVCLGPFSEMNYEMITKVWISFFLLYGNIDDWIWIAANRNDLYISHVYAPGKSMKDPSIWWIANTTANVSLTYKWLSLNLMECTDEKSLFLLFAHWRMSSRPLPVNE